MSKPILLHFWLCGLEVGLVLFPLLALWFFFVAKFTYPSSLFILDLQFLALFLVVLELFGVIDQQEVFQEVGGEFGDMGEGVQEFLEDDQLFAEVFFVVAGEDALLGGRGERVAGLHGREDFAHPYEVTVPAAD
jgi:hypothetical protein